MTASFFFNFCFPFQSHKNCSFVRFFKKATQTYFCDDKTLPKRLYFCNSTSFKKSHTPTRKKTVKNISKKISKRRGRRWKKSKSWYSMQYCFQSIFLGISKRPLHSTNKSYEPILVMKKLISPLELWSSFPSRHSKNLGKIIVFTHDLPFLNLIWMDWSINGIFFDEHQ